MAPMLQRAPTGFQKPIRAAQYVRMSTEHQQYSTENQSETRRDRSAQSGRSRKNSCPDCDRDCDRDER